MTATPILAVPYWAWEDKEDQVLQAITENRESNEIKFVWPLLKDCLRACICVVSSSGLEIAPYLPPFEKFGSYTRASHRIFMSATVTDDSFLVKGLKITPEAIARPLIYKNEKWSGEKMLLIPSLLGDTLKRDEMLKAFATPARGRHFGVVALTPSFAKAGHWKHYGAIVADSSTIEAEISRLRRRDGNTPVVVANRYDGIDLPDDACRILVLDGVPFSESLVDRYEEEHRAGSTLTLMRRARTIEQGLGRAVRGEKDYCVIIIIGEDLVRLIRDSRTRKLLSPQTRKQVELGLIIVEMAGEEKLKEPIEKLHGIIHQSLSRDEKWKEFYVQEMDSLDVEEKDRKILELLAKELEAEQADRDGNPQLAIRLMQSLIDTYVTDNEDRGWYMQQMARIEYHRNKTDANKLQLEAHIKNRYLLKPRVGMQVEKMEAISEGRIQRIREWLNRHETAEDVIHEIEEIVSKLQFQTRANIFKESLHRLGEALGFKCQRPDKEWGQGPDNLWAVAEGEFILFECKSDCNSDKAEIDRKETGQMDNSIEWFKADYSGAKMFPILIHPASKLAPGAALPDEVEIMRKKGLKDLAKNVRNFFQLFSSKELRDINDDKFHKWLNDYSLTAQSLYQDYTSHHVKA